MKIIGVTGAQGAGKSTILTELKTQQHLVDDFKVSRSVQAELGWDSLEKVMTSPQVMMQFQEKVFEKKYANELELATRAEGVTIFTERTFADLVAYAKLWTWAFVDRRELDFGIASSWLGAYERRCMVAQRACYSGVILLPMMDHIVFEDDPHRAKSSDISTAYTEMSEFCKAAKVPYFTITEKTIQNRVREVLSFVEGLSNEDNQ
jgi:predicted ATPase